jgi:hypothetical protein
LPSHLRLCITNGLFPSDSPTKTLQMYVFLILRPSHPIALLSS